MKAKINIILPIALSILLPGLSIFSNYGFSVPNRLGVMGSWLCISIIMYLLWHLLWHLWEFKAEGRTLRFWGMLVSLTFAMIAFVALLAYNSLEDLKWYYGLRLFLAAMLFLAVQYALRAQGNIASLRLEKEQLQTENYKAQLKVIRAQIDPHFLFNSLNTLRSMVRQQHEQSEAFILSLSDFYRQTLKHNENTTIPLAEEVAVLESYLFLMKSRNEAAVQLSLNIDTALHSMHLPTLALQVVAENCFKHNSMTTKKPLHIHITSTEDHYIMVSNNKQPMLLENTPSGYGLKLLQKRYGLLNIEKGVLIEETPDNFRVKIKLISA